MLEAGLAVAQPRAGTVLCLSLLGRGDVHEHAAALADRPCSLETLAYSRIHNTVSAALMKRYSKTWSRPAAVSR